MENDNNNNRENLQPPIPKNNSSKQSGIFLLIVLVILVAAAVLVFLSFGGQKKKAAIPNQTSNTSTDTLQTEQSVMLGQSKIKFPAITQAQLVSSSTLPADIASFIHSGASGLKVEKITYGSAGTGYRINYQIAASDMQPLYFSFDQNEPKGYKVILGSRNLYFSLIELQSSAYQVRVSLIMVQNNLAQAQIIVFPI